MKTKGTTFLGLLQQSTKNWVGETTEIYCLMVLAPRTLKSRCQQSHAPWDNPASTSSWCQLESLGIPWLVGASPQARGYLLSVHRPITSLLCMPISESKCPSLEGHHIGLGLTLMTSFKLDYLCKDPIAKYGHILTYWGLGFQHTGFGGGEFAHNRKKRFSSCGLLMRVDVSLPPPVNIANFCCT